MQRRRTNSRAVDFRRGLASYTPQKRLAVGGMAEVWRGEAKFDDGQVLPVAIKRVRPELSAHSFYRGMFQDEARLGMLLRHEHIVRVYDAREVSGTFIIIMELVDGPSLRELLSRAFERGTPMPTEAALSVGISLAEALQYAHTAIDDFGRSLDIVHRDVSPHNVLLGASGQVKLMDFGLAYASANHMQRNPDEIGGKLGYLAPEVLVHKQSSPAIDIFALGVTLWEALAGRRLFRGKDDQDTVRRVIACQVPALDTLNPKVPKVLAQVVGAAVCEQPGGRPTADELADALHEVAQRMGLSAENDGLSRMVRLYERIERAERRPRRLTGSVSFSAAEKLERDLLALADEVTRPVVLTNSSRPPPPRAAAAARPDAVASPASDAPGRTR